MIRLGLTGGIASGKSTVAAMFAREGIPVFNADAVVHRLYRRADVIASIGASFPGCVQDGKIDRLVLAEEVFFDHAKLHALERLLHPLVHREERVFWRRGMLERRWCVISEIPLLFESDAQGRYDAVILADAPPMIQKQRALRRKGMTEGRLEHILQRQWRLEHKRKFADIAVPTGAGKAVTYAAVRNVLMGLRRNDDA